jgi:hypothetical protein
MPRLWRGLGRGMQEVMKYVQKDVVREHFNHDLLRKRSYFKHVSTWLKIPNETYLIEGRERLQETMVVCFFAEI